MTREDIQAVIDQHPTLTDHGFGIYRAVGQKLTPEQRAAEMAKGRDALLDAAEACTRVCVWLKDKPRNKGVNDRHSSYGWKHVAETEIGYVTNGQFIAAALHSGLTMDWDGGANAAFNLAESVWKDAAQREGSLV